MDAQVELAQIIRDEAASAAPEHGEALHNLANTVECLPGHHRTARVLRHLRPFEEREFPNARVRALISAYGTGVADEQGFLDDVVEAIHPGVGTPQERSDALLKPGETEAWYQLAIRLLACLVGFAAVVGFLAEGYVDENLSAGLAVAGTFGFFGILAIWIGLRDWKRRRRRA